MVGTLKDDNGILVEVVDPDGTAAKVGVQIGDWLLAYQDRVLSSPAALLAAEENVVGMPQVTLCLRRENETLTLAVLAGSLGIEARPDLPAEAMPDYEAGRAALRAEDLDKAAACWEEAAQAAQLTKGSASAAWLLMRAGDLHQKQSLWEAARAAYEKAWLLLEEGGDGDTTARSRCLFLLGQCSQSLNDFLPASGWYERARQVDAAAGNEKWVAASCNNLGRIAYSRGDLEAANDFFTCALQMRQKWKPGSLEVAASLNNLGAVAYSRGDLDSARDYHARALRIRQELAPDSLDVAYSINNLGAVAHARNDLIAAQDAYTRALEIWQRLAPDSPDVAGGFNNLGEVAFIRGDLTSAYRYHTYALHIRQEIIRDSLGVAVSLNNLGVILQRQGDLDSARDYYARALRIRQQLAPRSLDTAISLGNLASVAYDHNDFPAAREYYGRAVEIVDDQRRQITSAESRALLVAQYAQLHAGLLCTCIALGDMAEAHATLERTRARGLIELLAERNLDISGDVPDEMLRTQQALDRKRNALYRELSQVNGERDKAHTDELHHKIDGLVVEQRTLIANIQRISPRYAALQYPRSVDVAAAQQALDPGTLALQYAVDDQETFLFVVTAADVQLHRLPVDQENLRLRVRNFRRALAQRSGYAQEARALYDLLVRPAQNQLDHAERLLLCPDGPLHALPFAALIQTLSDTSQRADAERFLVEAKPLHTVASLGLYARLRQPATQANEARTAATPLLALGDPAYPQGAATAHGATRAYLTRGGKLTPLPGTRNEVRAIGRLYGDGALTRLGRRANKAEVRRHGGSAKVLHLACHGLLDDRDPLASALALSPEGDEDDGLLRAYEIFTGLRLNADLVVLSACSTGLGQETKHEGVLGMTRALQYAGARSVVVSLWEVLDTSTSALMVAFHKALRAGVSKDEALRAAQLSLLRGGNARRHHPYHWAAFTLAGDRTSL